MSHVHAFIRHLMIYNQKVKKSVTICLPFSWLMLIVNICLLACECFKFNRSDLSQRDRDWNSVVWKVFKTYDNDFIVDIQISKRALPISMNIDTRNMKYISKLKLSTNKILAGLFQISGYLQLIKLLSHNNMPDICYNFKDHLLDIFFVKMLYMFSYFYPFYSFSNFYVYCKDVSYILTSYV